MQIEIAAPIEVVWECLIDDDKIGQWSAGVISIQEDGSALIRQFGRIRAASITTISELPQKKLELLSVTPARRSSTVYRLEPTATGTRLVTFAESGRRGILRLLLIPYGMGSTRTLRAKLNLLRLCAERIARSDATNLTEIGEDSAEDFSGGERGIAKLLSNSSPELARVWGESSRLLRESVLFAWRAGVACPDPRGAQLTRAIATTYWLRRRSRIRTLVINTLALVSFAVTAILMFVAGHVVSAIFLGVLAYFFLSLVYVTIAQLWPVYLAAIHDNTEWLDNYERVEALIDRSRSSEAQVRSDAVTELGAVECLGPLNLRAEAALAEAIKQGGSLGEAATVALKARRARARLAAT